MDLQRYLLLKKQNLAIYYTAGFPKLDSTAEILIALDQGGADLVEIGLPFSDSLVDGPTIQVSNQVALTNGQTVENVLAQIKRCSSQVKTPIVLMGSYNPILQFGVREFVIAAREAGISAVIIPDLPPEVFEKEYQQIFNEFNLGICFLVTSHATEARIRYLDQLTTGFIYLVSSDSTTGSKLELGSKQREYFERIAKYQLKSPLLVGFGITDTNSFQAACEFSAGAIIGSHFIRNLEGFSNYQVEIKKYIESIKGI